MDTCLTFGELFLIVYSTTDRTSFDEARLLVKYIQQHKTIQPSPYLITIVATKKDLKQLRKVEEYEGRFLAQDVDGLFYQVSISEGYDEIQEMLEEVLRACLNRDKNKGSSTLSRMKEGIIVKTKSLRRKSTSDSSPAEQVRPTTLGQNTSPVSVT